MERSFRELLPCEIWDLPCFHIFPREALFMYLLMDLRTYQTEQNAKGFSTVTPKNCLLLAVSWQCWECPISSLDFPYREGASILVHGTEGTDSTLQGYLPGPDHLGTKKQDHPRLWGLNRKRVAAGEKSGSVHTGATRNWMFDPASCGNGDMKLMDSDVHFSGGTALSSLVNVWDLLLLSIFVSPSCSYCSLKYFIPPNKRLLVVCCRLQGNTKSVKHGLVSQSLVCLEVKDTNQRVRRSGDL